MPIELHVHTTWPLHHRIDADWIGEGGDNYIRASSYKQFEHAALTLNPLALLLTQMGYAFVHPAPVPTEVAPGVYVPVQHMRSALVASGGLVHVLISLSLIPLTFALGWWFFTREAPRVAENL